MADGADDGGPARYLSGMTPRQLDLLALVGCATCWGAVLLAWLGGAIYYDTPDSGERTRMSPTRALWAL